MISLCAYVQVTSTLSSALPVQPVLRSALTLLQQVRADETCPQELKVARLSELLQSPSTPSLVVVDSNHPSPPPSRC